MLFTRPDWINHNSEKGKRQSIYSIHFHPLGKKFATGGHAPVSVKIWSAESLSNDDPTSAKLLSSLVNHDANVMAVRWSNNQGRHLASAGDDKNIMIWEMDMSGEKRIPFGSTDAVANVENYRIVRILRGHDSDVLDLAWSPDNDYIVSCSLDSYIAVWDAKTFELIRKIPGHANFVKGLAWDPVGKYLSTQSDDRSVIIWATNGPPTEWEQATKVIKPFAHSTGGTWFTRLGWSPEGSFLCAPSATTEGVDVAALLDRGQEWKSDLFFVGHSAPVEIAQFAPVMFRRNVDGEPPFAIVATGSEDGAICIWSTNHKLALVALEGCFTGPIHDLTWSPNGKYLLACSHDGFVAAIHFEGDEIGSTLLPAELESMMEKYGFRRKKAFVPEDTRQLDLEALPITLPIQHTTQHVPLQQAPTQPSIPLVPMDIDSVPVTHAPPVHVVRGKDGKKRVQPTFVRSLAGEDDGPSNPTFVQEASSAQVSSVHPSQLPTVPMSAMFGGVEWQAISNFVAQGKSMMTIVSPQILVKANEVEDRLSRTVDRSGKGITVIECRNERGKGTCRVRASVNGQREWEDVLGSFALQLVATQNFTAVGCKDGTIFVWTPSGRRLFPCMMMDAPIAYLSCDDTYLGALTCTGLVDVWNVLKPASVLTGISVAPCLSKVTEQVSQVHQVKRFLVLSNGNPLVITCDDSSYTFLPNMQTWVKVSDKNDLEISTYTNGIPQPSNVTIRQLQALARGKQKVTEQMVKSGRRVTIQAIENQLAAALAINSREEYTSMMKFYAQKLVEEAAVNKAAELMDDLYFGRRLFTEMEEMERHQLLKDLIPLLGKARSMQRVTAQVSESLGI